LAAFWIVRQGWAALSEGVYLLRTNLVGWEPEALWKTYIQPTDVEAAFRTIKSDLVLRPIYHQIERRVHGSPWAWASARTGS